MPGRNIFISLALLIVFSHFVPPMCKESAEVSNWQPFCLPQVGWLTDLVRRQQMAKWWMLFNFTRDSLLIISASIMFAIMCKTVYFAVIALFWLATAVLASAWSSGLSFLCSQGDATAALGRFQSLREYSTLAWALGVSYWRRAQNQLLKDMLGETDWPLAGAVIAVYFILVGWDLMHRYSSLLLELFI